MEQYAGPEVDQSKRWQQWAGYDASRPSPPSQWGRGPTRPDRRKSKTRRFKAHPDHPWLHSTVLKLVSALAVAATLIGAGIWLAAKLENRTNPAPSPSTNHSDKYGPIKLDRWRDEESAGPVVTKMSAARSGWRNCTKFTSLKPGRQ